MMNKDIHEKLNEYNNNLLKFHDLRDESFRKFILIKDFDIIWRTYAYMLPINEKEFENYRKIINKLRYNNYDYKCIEEQDKNIFINLIEKSSNIIYKYKKYDIKYNEKNYDNSKTYDDIELTCCYNFKKYLESNIK